MSGERSTSGADLVSDLIARDEVGAIKFILENADLDDCGPQGMGYQSHAMARAVGLVVGLVARLDEGLDARYGRSV